jgi:hypothetical protein
VLPAKLLHGADNLNWQSCVQGFLDILRQERPHMRVNNSVFSADQQVHACRTAGDALGYNFLYDTVDCDFMLPVVVRSKVPAIAYGHRLGAEWNDCDRKKQGTQPGDQWCDLGKSTTLHEISPLETVAPVVWGTDTTRFARRRFARRNDTEVEQSPHLIFGLGILPGIWRRGAMGDYVPAAAVGQFLNLWKCLIS